METQKVYKALIEVDGRLESVIAGLGQFTEFKGLTYKEGEITYAPKDSIGLFVYDDIDKAKSLLKGNHSYTDRGRRVVCEVTPLGNQMERSSVPFGFMARYPAILLGKEVWTDKPKEPTELERLCEARALLGGNIRTCIQTGLHFFPEGRKYALYRKHGIWALYEGNRHLVATKDTLQEIVSFVKQDKPRPEPKFKIGDRVKVTGSQYTRKEDFTVELIHWGADKPYFSGHAHWHYGFKTAGYHAPKGYFVDEEHLELAPEPKEAWVDVTKECTADIEARGGYFGYALRLMDGDKHIASFGKQGIIDCYGYNLCYKIEFVQDGGANGGFKVLKKVMK